MSSNIRIQRICEHCGNDFEAQTTRTRYCSHICNSRAYKAMKRAEKIQVSTTATQAIKEKPIQDLRDKEFLSISETCMLLGLSRTTLWRAIKANKLNAAKVGRRTLVKRSDIDSLFA